MRPIDFLLSLWPQSFAVASVAAALILTLPAVAAVSKVDPASKLAANQPLVGLWQSVIQSQGGVAPNKGGATTCRETLDYRVNHIRLGASGKEITRATFDVSATPSAAGFYRVTETVLASNGKVDCAGDVHAATDNTVVRFFQFSPKHDQFIVCKSESLAACFGPFVRQP